MSLPMLRRLQPLHQLPDPPHFFRNQDSGPPDDLPFDDVPLPGGFEEPGHSCDPVKGRRRFVND